MKSFSFHYRALVKNIHHGYQKVLPDDLVTGKKGCLYLFIYLFFERLSLKNYESCFFRDLAHQAWILT